MSIEAALVTPRRLRSVQRSAFTPSCEDPKPSVPVVYGEAGIAASLKLPWPVSLSVSDISGECSAPPFSGVVGSGRWSGVNFGSRVFRAGFTNTQRVLVSAVPSASVGGPASLLGGPGI